MQEKHGVETETVTSTRVIAFLPQNSQTVDHMILDLLIRHLNVRQVYSAASKSL